MFGELHREVSDSLPLCVDLVNQIKAPRQIHNRSTQRLIHRDEAHAVASDPSLVAQSLEERLPEAYCHVLDRVVIVYLQIAFAFNLEIKQPVSREQVEHVIEKGYSGVDATGSRPIKSQLNSDVCLFCLTGDLRFAGVRLD